MITLRHIRFFGRNPSAGNLSGKNFLGQAAGLACLALFLVASPARSFAICELPGDAEAAAAQIVPLESGNLNILVTNVELMWEFDLDTMLRTPMGIQDQTDSQTIFTTLNTWLSEMVGPLKNQTAQLSAGIVDETRDLGEINDASNNLAAAQYVQKEEIKSKLESQPTDQACRFDTTANYVAQDRVIADALQRGFEWDFVSAANNEYQGIGQYGPGELQNNRWDIYVKNFCDYTAEDCDSGCSAPGGSVTGAQCSPLGGTAPRYPDYDIYVSRMLFLNKTIPVNNPNNPNNPNPGSFVEPALLSMMLNVTGYKIPDVILSGAIGTVPGMEQMFTRREYMAQMSAVGSLLYSIAADRMQGVKAQGQGITPSGPVEMRTMMGVENAYPSPSLREIRQSVVEQLWDPSFYKNLGDDPATISEKELYLKAYGLTMLYDMISKQEKISTAYAVETAEILKEAQYSRVNAFKETPLHQ